MSQAIIESVEAAHLKRDLPPIDVGQTVDVHCRIIEGDKERTQVFTGVVIAARGRGINRTITVRRIVANEGVERIFPLHSPNIARIEIRRHGKVRRAKLYYLRDRVGKARRLSDRRRGLKHIGGPKRGRRRREEVQVPTDEAGAEPQPAASAEAAAEPTRS